MKKKLFLLISAIFFTMACSEKKQNKKMNDEPFKKEIKDTVSVNDSLVEHAVIYEANIRQYSPEGTFKAFEKDIPVLKELGVKIIWLMPIHPISKVKRKAKGDVYVEQIPDSIERKKYLGSYYSVADYQKVNPEFGTMHDLIDLINTAHQNGMIVILDWVANHTGWDHAWIKDHPEYYTKNEKGEITDPLNPDGTSKGWGDVADLNYDNFNLRKAMIEEMKFWVKNTPIDGFRCDVAGEVPLDFWEEAISELRKIKPLFMLAEAWEPELLKDSLFDAAYAWEGHFLLADIAKQKKKPRDWDVYMQKIDTMYKPDDILMYFVSNHDENSWKGTVYETFGEAAEATLVLTYLVPGMPLIYSGEEYGLNHRLKFFEKDSIPKTKGKWFDIYKRLGQLKNNELALKGGKRKGSYIRLKTTDERILAFKRSFDNSEIAYIANFSDKPIKFKVDLQGKYEHVFTGHPLELNGQKELELDSWKYLLLRKIKS